MPANPHPALFDPANLAEQRCPVPGCGAIRFPQQNKAITCAHDLDPNRRRRPRECLNRVDPAIAPFPEGY